MVSHPIVLPGLSREKRGEEGTNLHGVLRKGSVRTTNFSIETDLQRTRTERSAEQVVASEGENMVSKFTAVLGTGLRYTLQFTRGDASFATRNTY